ncbi:3'-5' exonuclease [Pseudoalteromonas rubra]|uniref:3'-5' exonuclease n=1 Tax=Pseudoalteromonas rubra TaxID=43658 RepID=A0A5S3UX00_9GAMM|nr:MULTISPECIES: 3'-5' exonuclease [Pseudoalteromonas]QPB84548.1 3'-5' exonuclease [Pseudoalteromonas rubra]
MSWLTRLRNWHTYRHLRLEDANLIVLDLELTGLDPKRDEIVSAAWVEIRQGRITLSTARHMLNKEVRQLGQSPVIHGVDEQALAQGTSLRALLQQLAELFEQGVLVCHNAILDWGFLKRAFVSHGISVRPELILDTMQIERNRLLRQGQTLAADCLTLSACRQRYGLPSACEHHALSDALSTAELLLAQNSQFGGTHGALLRQLT